MIRHLHLYICSIALAFFTNTSCINAQILQDSLALTLIKSGIDNMYNMEFDAADEKYAEIERLYPGHPVNYLIRGINTYWKNYPLLPTSPARNLFEEDLRKCIELSSQKSYAENYETESLLAEICARGLLLVFYTDNDLSMNVIPLVPGTYRLIMRSFDFVLSYSDFYYFTGLYKYYREAYPRIHPVYKPLAALFPPGDMMTGLNELVKSAEHSIFLKAESYSILTWIYTGYENNFIQASAYSRTLTDLYPENLFFKSLHIKNLLLLKEYDQAEDLIKDSPKDSLNTYYNAQILIFNGIIQEKKYKNYALAQQFYEEGINAVSFFGDYGKEFCGFAYLGLSRTSEYFGDKAGRKAYRRKGSDLINFKKVNFD